MRKIIKTIGILFAVLIVTSVFSVSVLADDTIVDSGTDYYCDWELDADGNLLVVCKRDQIYFDRIFDNNIHQHLMLK